MTSRPNIPFHVIGKGLLCLEASLHSLTLHSSLVHAGLCVCEREEERERGIVIMCVEFLTNSLPFANPCGIITEIILRKITNVSKTQQTKMRRFVYPSKFELVQSCMVSLFPFIFRNLSQLSQPL